MAESHVLIPIEMPRAVPVQAVRLPQANIPQTRLEREGLKTVIARYVEANRATLTPPLVLGELRSHAEKIIARAGMPAIYTD